MYAKQRRAVKVDDIRRAMGESTFSQNWPIEPQKILAAVFAVTLILAFVVGSRMSSDVVERSAVGSSVGEVNLQIEAYPPESIIGNGQVDKIMGVDVAKDRRNDSD